MYLFCRHPGQALCVNFLINQTCHLQIWSSLPLSSILPCHLSAADVSDFIWEAPKVAKNQQLAVSSQKKGVLRKKHPWRQCLDGYPLRCGEAWGGVAHLSDAHELLCKHTSLSNALVWKTTPSTWQQIREANSGYSGLNSVSRTLVPS